MADGGKNGWKIFGIAIIVVLIASGIALAAFFADRGCGKEEGTTTTTRTQFAPSENIVPESPGGAAGTGTSGAGTTTTTGTTTTSRYVTGEAEGSTPCVGGTRTTTRTTYWSDGSTDTTTITEPCTP